MPHHIDPNDPNTWIDLHQQTTNLNRAAADLARRIGQTAIRVAETNPEGTDRPPEIYDRMREAYNRFQQAADLLEQAARTACEKTMATAPLAYQIAVYREPNRQAISIFGENHDLSRPEGYTREEWAAIIKPEIARTKQPKAADQYEIAAEYHEEQQAENAEEPE